MREFEVYCAYYCAVCRAVGRKYGELPRLMLSYDAAFIAILGDALEIERKGVDFNTFRCFNNPIRKRNEVLSSPSIDYAADVLVLLGYLGLKDKKEDGDAGNVLKRGAINGGEAFMRSAGKKASLNIPEQALEVYSCLSLQAELEKAKTQEIDKAADPIGQFMATILDFSKVPGFTGSLEMSKTLRRFGYHLGRFIYIVDAIDDIERDEIRGTYNPLQFHELDRKSLKISLSLDLANMAECVNELPLVYHKEIIENIIYLGLNAVKDEVLEHPLEKSRNQRRYLRP